MKISLINNSNQVNSIKKVTKVTSAKSQGRTDKVEISKQAKEIAKNGSTLSPERLAQIKDKIQNNFYDRDDVLEHVAEQILKSSEFKDSVQNNKINKNI